MKSKVLLSTAALAASWMLSAGSAVAEEIELKMASWGPAKHYVAQARVAWVNEVNEAAKGKVKIVEYPGGQLYGPKDMHTAVAKGKVDIGVALQPRMMSMVPMLQGVYLPFAYDSVDDAAKAYQGESREIIEEALAKKRMKLIYTNFTGGVQLYSSKGNVEDLEGFKDLRVLSTSPMMTEIFWRLGASPDTSIPQTEQYMALKRGVADASLNSIVAGFFQKTHEVNPYMTTMDMSFPTVMVVMNTKTWDKLPKDVQEIMLSIGQKKEAYTLAVSKGWDQKFTAELAKAGATVKPLPEPVRQQIKERSRSVWTEWANANGSEAQRLLKLNMQ